MDLAAELYGDKPKGLDLAADLYGTAPVETFDPTEGMSTFDKVAAGAGKAVVDAGRGLGQLVGLVSQQDIDEAKERDKARMRTGAGMAGNVAGNVAMLAPAAMIPGAGTVTGAAAIGGLQGALLTPGGLVERAKAALFGAGGGAAGAKAGQYLTGRLAAKEAEAAAMASRNAVRDTSLREGMEAGYVNIPSSVNPTFFNNRLESLAGKAALGQEAGLINQGATNAVSREALNLPENAALSRDAVNSVINKARGPYQAVAALPGEAPVKLVKNPNTRFPIRYEGPTPPTPAEALEALKQARRDATTAFQATKVPGGNPRALLQARAAEAEANVWEAFLEEAAQRSGNPAMVDSLRAARKTMAKANTVKRALNPSTGDVVATDLGRLIDKGAPLSDGLEVAGNFANSVLPSIVREGSSIPTPGVSKLEHLAAAALAMGGAASTGGPGVLLGLLPYTAGAARKVLLSKWYQQMMAQPNYAPSLTTKALGQVSPRVGAVAGMSLADLAR